MAHGEERYYTIDTDVLFERKSKLLVINRRGIATTSTPSTRESAFPLSHTLRYTTRLFLTPASRISFKGTAETRLVNLNCANSTSSRLLWKCAMKK